MNNNQIKSKQRVSDYGEVFTAEREVNAMLDLVKHETERIDSRFLEPACGEGAFLKEILRRKLTVVKDKYGKSTSDYEVNSVKAVCSIYGIDILEDNAQICRNNLYEIWNKEYTKLAKKDATDKCRNTVKFILSKNIICGNALTMLCNDDSPIIFAEWIFIENNVKRRDFRLDELVSNELTTEVFVENWHYDEETNAFLPNPIKDYPVTNYLELSNYE